MKDVYGQTIITARKKLGLEDCRWPHTLRMVRGIWVAKWVVRGLGNMSWHKTPHYAALGPKGQVVRGISWRKNTITAAGGRLD